MITVANFLKKLAEMAALQVGVTVVTDTVWPRAKKAASRLLEKLNEQKSKQDFAKLAGDSEDLDDEAPGEPKQ